MAGTNSYAMPTKLPFVAKKTINKTMSSEVRAHFDRLLSKSVEVFRDSESGELYLKITDVNTGIVEIRKCEYTDED